MGGFPKTKQGQGLFLYQNFIFLIDQNMSSVKTYDTIFYTFNGMIIHLLFYIKTFHIVYFITIGVAKRSDSS